MQILKGLKVLLGHKSDILIQPNVTKYHVYIFYIHLLLYNYYWKNPRKGCTKSGHVPTFRDSCIPSINII